MALFTVASLSLLAFITTSVFLQLTASTPSPAPNPQLVEMFNKLFGLDNQCPTLPKGADFDKLDRMLVLNKILHADGTASYDCINGAIRAPTFGRLRAPGSPRRLVARGQISTSPAMLEAELQQWSRPEDRDPHPHGIKPGSPPPDWGRITETLGRNGASAILEHSSGHSLTLTQVSVIPSPHRDRVPWALLMPANDGMSQLQAETQRIQVFRVYTKTQAGVGGQCTGQVPGAYHAQYWVYTPRNVKFAGFEAPICSR